MDLAAQTRLGFLSNLKRLGRQRKSWERNFEPLAGNVEEVFKLNS
jgi:hypothetical protein